MVESWVFLVLMPSVVYFDQLLGAARTLKLVEILTNHWLSARI